MTTWMKIALVALLSLLALPATGLADDKILSFDTMTGVVRPFTGATNAIRGVPGGGIPWALTEAKGELRTDGRIRVRVRGLVLAEGARAGTNPVAAFKAIVSCLTPATDGTGALVASTVNRSTNTFPASPEGDSEIEDVVSLPTPCIAPIVFVTSPTGAWFSATGF
ncbi:MAG TPA: hypothetical protein VKC35_16880 [Vicinamibacterales bacterium]|nr:hypothetical protein [Vicinamibacterales bacterium]